MNRKIFLIAVVVCLLGTSLYLSVVRHRQQEGKIALPAISNAKAQSYAVAKYPTLKADDLILGPKSAKLIIYSYEDPSDIFSARLADTLDKLRADFGKDVAVVIRPFVNQNDEEAKLASISLLCAADQNKWEAMRAKLYSELKQEKFNIADISAYSSEIGLKDDDFRACLTNGEKSAKIEEFNREAGEYQVLGAPTLFVSDEMVLGARPYDDYEDSNGDKIEGLKSMIGKKIQ